MQRQDVSQDHQLRPLGPLGQCRSDQVGRRHQPIDVLVMLVEHKAIEAQLFGVDELVDVLLIDGVGPLAVPERIRTVTQPDSYLSSKSAGRYG